jgi:hypothetical protein
MHFLVTRTSRGPTSTLLWANVCIAVQPASLGKLILNAEYEAAIVDYAFRRMAVLHRLARLAIG